MEEIEPRVLMSGDIYSLSTGQRSGLYAPPQNVGTVYRVDATTGQRTIVKTGAPIDRHSAQIAVTAQGELVVATPNSAYNVATQYYGDHDPLVDGIRRYNLATGQQDLAVANVTGDSSASIAVAPNGDIFSLSTGQYPSPAGPAQNIGTVFKIDGSTGQKTVALTGVPLGGYDTEIALTPQGELVVATPVADVPGQPSHAIRRYNLTTRAVDLVVPNVTGDTLASITVAPNGDIYSLSTAPYDPNAPANGGVVFKIDGNTGRKTTVLTGVKISGPRFAKIAVTAEGELWVATPNSPFSYSYGYGPTNSLTDGVRRYNLATGREDLDVANVTGDDWASIAVVPSATVDVGANGPVTLSRDPQSQSTSWSTGSSAGTLAGGGASPLVINSGGGTAVLNLDYSHGDPLPATLVLNGNFVLEGFPAGGDPLAGHTIDIGGGSLSVAYAPQAPTAFHAAHPIISKTAVQSAASLIESYLKSGQIFSSTLGPGLLLAVTDTGSSVVLQPALAGDANLDGIVNFSDLLTLAQNYSGSGAATWMQGDFNYDQRVDFSDLLDLAQNYGKSGGANSAAVSKLLGTSLKRRGIAG